MNCDVPSYHEYRFPADIIAHAVWLYFRFSLSFRDIEDLLAQRGITVTYETIRQWCGTFGHTYARRLRRRRGQQGDTWSLMNSCVAQWTPPVLMACRREDGDVLDSWRTLSHARSEAKLEEHLELLRCHYNFVRPHGAVPSRLPTTPVRDELLAA